MSKTFKRPFLRLTVHENRVEVVEGMIPFRKRQTIPFRNIAAAEVSKFTKQLVIVTNGGEEYKFAFGSARKAEAARQALVERL